MIDNQLGGGLKESGTAHKRRESRDYTLLLTNQLQAAPTGGRELLCKLNHDTLKDIYGDHLILVELSKKPVLGMKSLVNTFRGHIDGLNGTVIDETVHKIRTANVRKVFVDGSNLGAFVKLAKLNCPDIEFSTFFHNVEARFFLGSLRQTKTLRALAILIANYLAERKSVAYSDKIICLNDRDSSMLRKLYGRGATHVSPMAVEDKMQLEGISQPAASSKKFALFVGGSFYANRAGIAWYVKHVVPRIRISTYIVGRGMDDMKTELERDGNVVVVGGVDSLAEWYRNAHFVIAPIFDGSGMKTKVAEALMFGKKIIGTPEAFTGYEDVVGQAGWVCKTAQDFIAVIEQVEDSDLKSYDPELRALYEDNYSFSAARSRLAEILGESITDAGHVDPATDQEVAGGS